MAVSVIRNDETCLHYIYRSPAIDPTPWAPCKPHCPLALENGLRLST